MGVCFLHAEIEFFVVLLNSECGSHLVGKLIIKDLFRKVVSRF